MAEEAGGAERVRGNGAVRVLPNEREASPEAHEHKAAAAAAAAAAAR